MKDVTDETFAVDVMERSKVVPVVVDLWAPWCQPCKALGPILEKVVGTTEGKVDLVKVNIDENPQIAQSFQVQSIPAVFGISNGEVIDAFVGAKGEAEVETFIEGLLPNPQDEILTNLLEEGSEQSLEEVLQAFPDHEEAVIRLAKIYVENGRSEEALDLLKRIPESPETRHISAQARTGDRSETEILERLDNLLKIVKSDENAREEFVDLLDVLGPENSETKTYRQKLSREIY
ncbi:MAG: co-chaperone YbbN [Actinobacteria bacterium]|nr:co-chaperone YbbN [Actinomycetota bacterium]